MSELSPHLTEHTPPAEPGTHDTERGTPRSPASARYLTDGLHLYRNLGPVDGSYELIGLEDCLSLEVLLVSSAELCDGGARAIKPVAADGG